MFDKQQYELLDFGRGRKLERLGGITIDRPAPGSEYVDKSDPTIWKTAWATFTRTSGEIGVWNSKGKVSDSWQVLHNDICFGLRPTPFGHVGLFPEQVGNWDWLGKRLQQSQSPPKVLNLFAYTGGSSLTSAVGGAEVVHVDAAKNVVGWARQNAEISQLDQHPIRWIVDDVQKFVARELRRGNRYDAVILDPPSYGHGPKGEAWKMERDLGDLLKSCAKLTKDRLQFMLLTCHTPDWGTRSLEQLVRDSFGKDLDSGLYAGTMCLRSSLGRDLSSGSVVRWPC